jgi:hypothetical protein
MHIQDDSEVKVNIWGGDNDLGDRRGYSHLKEEALDRIKWRNRFGRGFGPVVWQSTDVCMYERTP